MIAYGALNRRLLADNDMSAVRALPNGVAIAGEYEVALSSDDAKFGGHGRTDSSVLYRSSKQKNGTSGFFCYLPNRTVVVFRKRKKS